MTQPLTLEEVERLKKLYEPLANQHDSETCVQFCRIYAQLADVMRENERLRAFVGLFKPVKNRVTLYHIDNDVATPIELPAELIQILLHNHPGEKDV